MWRNQFVRVNEFTRSGMKRNTTTKLVWHYTANPGASAANHYTYFDSTLPDQNRRAIQTYGRTEAERRKLLRWANAHIFIDSREAICIVPLDELAYHAGPANGYSIGIELCIERDGSFHPNTFKQALAIGQELSRRYGLTIDDQLRHFDVNGKLCPKPWVDQPNEWLTFKAKLFQSEPIKEEDKVLELEHHWQWKMLSKALNGLYHKSISGEITPPVITDYKWVEKAYQGKLTKSELAWLNMIIFAKQNSIDLTI